MATDDDPIPADGNHTKSSVETKGAETSDSGKRKEATKTPPSPSTDGDQSRQPNLIRREALQGVSSSDSIRDLLVVTRRRGWLTLAAVGFVVAAIVIYSIFGRIPVKVKGAGMFVAGDDLYLVEVTSAGRLTEIKVKTGDQVVEGQLVAVLNSKDLNQQIDAVLQRIDLLEDQDDSLSLVEQSQLDLSEATLERSLDSLQQEIESSTKLRGMKQEQLTAQRELIKKGYISQNTLIATLQEVTQLEQAIMKSETSLKESRQSHESTRASIKQARASRLDELNQSRSQLLELQKRRDTQLQVYTDVAGVVVGVRQDRGAVLDAGDSLVEIQVGGRKGGPLKCLAYLSLKTGKRATVGMPAEVSPTVAKRSRYGFIDAKVSSVEEYVASDAQLDNVFANRSIVQQIRKDLGPVIRVKIEMESDPATVSGFRWSTRKGYPVVLTPGTEVQVDVIVEERRPISYVIPWLRSQLGE